MCRNIQIVYVIKDSKIMGQNIFDGTGWIIL